MLWCYLLVLVIENPGISVFTRWCFDRISCCEQSTSPQQAFWLCWCWAPGECFRNMGQVMCLSLDVAIVIVECSCSSTYCRENYTDHINACFYFQGRFFFLCSFSASAKRSISILSVAQNRFSERKQQPGSTTPVQQTCLCLRCGLWIWEMQSFFFLFLFFKAKSTCCVR